MAVLFHHERPFSVTRKHICLFKQNYAVLEGTWESALVKKKKYTFSRSFHFWLSSIVWQGFLLKNIHEQVFSNILIIQKKFKVKIKKF